jgi:hypothetical protein
MYQLQLGPANTPAAPGASAGANRAPCLENGPEQCGPGRRRSYTPRCRRSGETVSAPERLDGAGAPAYAFGAVFMRELAKLVVDA